MSVLVAAGPLGRFIRHEPEMAPCEADEPNGQIVLHRVAWVTEDGHTPPSQEASEAYARLWRWARRRVIPSKLVAAAQRRRRAALEQLKACGYTVWELEAKPVWRAVVGLGDEVPQETGLRLHGTYGFPILPGQSLKGLAAAQSRQDSDETAVALGFGLPRRGQEDKEAAQGMFVFFDALPSTGELHVDVMTPHVGEYYRSADAAPPAEWCQPNPVHFLVVADSVRFQVHVAGRDADEQIVQWLAAGLRERGIGAKTSAGYGYMSVSDPRRT